MDPLSITASVITVIHAANAVISVCRNYRSSVKNSSWELPKIIEEVRNLRNVLEALEKLAVNAESADGSAAVKTRLPTLKRLCEAEVGPLARCLAELESLGKRLDPPSWSGPAGSKRKGLIEALGWPLKENETKKTLENIERLKTTLSLALTVDQGTLTVETHSLVEKTHDITQDGRNDLMKLNHSLTSMNTSNQPDNLYEKILRWLAAPDPSLNHNAARKKWQAATGSWFVGSEQFIDWKRNPNTFLWLHGIPGCGKTILSSTIIEDALTHCGLNPNLAVAYFYFDFNDTEKQEPDRMIRSLVSQLGRQRSTGQALRSLYSACRDGGRSPTSDELLSTLRGMVQEFDGVFIILDALDESKEREKLLESISAWAAWGIGRLHTLVTSRRESDIEDSLDCFIKDCQKVSIQSTLVDEDIRTYVHKQLRTDRGMKRWQKHPEVQKEIETTLMEKADGMFRWAACQLDSLKNCLNLKALRKALKTLPATLDETYARILKNICSEYEGNAFTILQWLVYSARPLRLEEVVDVIAVDVKGDPRFDLENRLAEPREILKICSSLVTVHEDDENEGTEGYLTEDDEVEGTEGYLTEDDNREEYGGYNTQAVIRLAHFSVKEYLVSDRIRAGSAAWYSIQEIPANRSMAEVCLAYLLQFDKPSLDKETVKEYPLARYAAEFWMQHAHVAGEDNCAMNSLCMELLQGKGDAFMNSIRLFNPDRPYYSLDLAKTSADIASAVYYTAMAGLVEVTRLLIEAGADVDAQGGLYGTALQAASGEGDNEIVQQLLDAGADVNAQGGLYGTALQAASREGDNEIVQQLLDAGADVNAQGGEYHTALQAASREGHNEIVQQLLEAGADVNAQGGKLCYTALQAASREGHNEIVQQLLEAGADVNAQGGKLCYTALQAASRAGHNEIVQQLLEAGADVNAQGGKLYYTALQAASEKGHGQIVQQLLEAGADVNTQGGDYYTALQAVSYGGHDQIVQRLLEAGADVSACGGRYHTALQAASYGEHDQIVQQLLDAGADVNACGGRYHTALQAASYGEHDRIVQRLLDAGADVNAQGGYFYTALQAASSRGHDQMVQQLLEAGADVNAQGGYFYTALQAASSRGHDQMVQQLLEAGADVNACGGEYYTALRGAAAGGYDRIVQRLLKAGADIEAEPEEKAKFDEEAESDEESDSSEEKVSEFGTAVQLALDRGHDQIVQRLLQAGASYKGKGDELESFAEEYVRK
ncbi:MAG: hypothetical protein M1836_007492 [Candelina mexicana]|nr:MAG: hypothetical protein M1836_007492 [Candelina mexicana]